jgi:hypothetical protein
MTTTPEAAAAGVPDGSFTERLEAAFRAYVDTINELGDDRIVAIARTHMETSFRLARDHAANPPKTITGTRA